jgi:ankyrin repeat protein
MPNGALTDDTESLEHLLCEAVKENDEQKIINLLKSGACINGKNDRNKTPLFCAVERFNLDLVQFLLEHGADPNIKSIDILARSYSSGMCRSWYNASTKISPLQRACFLRQPSIVYWLVRKGADLNQRDSLWGFTPLMEAAFRGDEKSFKLLLSRGASLQPSCYQDYKAYANFVDALHYSPLLCAVEGGNKEIIQLLLEAGVCAHEKEKKYGFTPLSLIDYLIKNKNLNPEKMKQYKEIEELLVRYGAPMSDFPGTKQEQKKAFECARAGVIASIKGDITTYIREKEMMGKKLVFKNKK